MSTSLFRLAARPHRLRRTSVLIGLAAVLVPTTASATTLRFSATFEAERSVAWEQPRGVNLIDCNGQHYYAAHGDDTTTIKTRRRFKVAVTITRRGAFWQFGGTPTAANPFSFAIEGHGVSTRSYSVQSGTTGGWCGGGRINPQPKNDCGTRLPVYDVSFSGSARELTWSASFAHRVNERYDFYDCTLIVPTGMYAGSFPSPGTVNRAALGNRRLKTIAIAASKNTARRQRRSPTWASSAPPTAA